MPRVSDDDDAGGLRPHCPGLYRFLLERKCRHEVMPDPRLLLIEDDAACKRQIAETDRKVAALFEERLAAGEPVEAGYLAVVGGHYGLPRDIAPQYWQREDRFMVHPDDTVEMRLRKGS